jgi:hypothetical protein
MGQLLQKLNFKKQTNSTIEQQAVLGLGLVSGLHGAGGLTANQLAAKGIKLSLREQLIG